MVLGLNACPVKCVTYFTGVSQKPSEADLIGVKFLPNEMFTPLNACPMKYEVNFIGAKPVYLGRSQFHRGFPKKRSEADLTGQPAAAKLARAKTGLRTPLSLKICVICVICGPL
jgi:hypothetical protein